MSDQRRLRLYLGIAALYGVLAVGTAALKPTFDLIVSDARGYYVYLPSLVIDGDLDFSNQIREHWGVDFSPELLEQRTELGLVRNRYPIGVALTLAPAFLLAHVFGGDGYGLHYQLLMLLQILAMGFAVMWLSDRMATRHFGCSAQATLWAVIGFWVATHFAYYYFREPFMAHVTGAFWVTLTLWLICEERTWAFCAGMAIVCRPTNAALAPLLLYAFAKRPSPWVLTGALPILAQLWVWHGLFGHWVHFSYEGEGFNWAQPHLFDTLFSSRHGLFFWSPLLLVACIGLPRRFWPSMLLLWYANAAWHQWWFGDAFGARAFLDFAPMFILGLAARPAPKPFVVLCALYTWGLMALYITHRIPRDQALFQP